MSNSTDSSYKKWEYFNYDDAEKEIENQPFISASEINRDEGLKLKSKLENEALNAMHKSITILEEKFRGVSEKGISLRRRRKREKFSTYIADKSLNKSNENYFVDGCILRMITTDDNKSIHNRLERKKTLKRKISRKRGEAELLRQTIAYRDHAQQLHKERKFELSLQEYKNGIDRLRQYVQLLGDTSSYSHIHQRMMNFKQKLTISEECCGLPFHNNSISFNQVNGKIDNSTSQLVLPQQNNSYSIVLSLSYDLNFGAGKVEYDLEKWAECANTLKKVLLMNKRNGKAWITRGNAFRKMGLPILGKLHIENAALCGLLYSKQSRNELVFIKKEINVRRINMRKPQTLFSKFCLQNTNKNEMDIVCHRSVKELLIEGLTSYKQALTIFEERFLETSANKFLFAAYCINQTQILHGIQLPSCLNRVRIVCCIGCAICYMLMDGRYHAAEKNCSNALNLLLKEKGIKAKKLRLIAILRRADCREKRRKFDEALEDMRVCLKLDSDNDGGFKSMIIAKMKQYIFLRAQTVGRSILIDS